jgi:hypothetical protein
MVIKKRSINTIGISLSINQLKLALFLAKREEKNLNFCSWLQQLKKPIDTISISPSINQLKLAFFLSKREEKNLNFCSWLQQLEKNFAQFSPFFLHGDQKTLNFYLIFIKKKMSQHTTNFCADMQVQVLLYAKNGLPKCVWLMDRYYQSNVCRWINGHWSDKVLWSMIDTIDEKF